MSHAGRVQEQFNGCPRGKKDMFKIVQTLHMPNQNKTYFKAEKGKHSAKKKGAGSHTPSPTQIWQLVSPGSFRHFSKTGFWFMPGAHWNWLEHNVVFAQACQIYPSRRCKGRPQSGQHKRFVKQWQFLNESESSIGHLLNRLPLSASKTSIWIHTRRRSMITIDDVSHRRGKINHWTLTAMNVPFMAVLHLGSDDCVPVRRRWGRGTQINWVVIVVIGISCTNWLELGWKQACYSNNFRKMNTDPQTLVNIIRTSLAAAEKWCWNPKLGYINIDKSGLNAQSSNYNFFYVSSHPVSFVLVNNASHCYQQFQHQ